MWKLESVPINPFNTDVSSNIVVFTQTVRDHYSYSSIGGVCNIANVSSGPARVTTSRRRVTTIYDGDLARWPSTSTHGITLGIAQSEALKTMNF